MSETSEAARSCCCELGADCPEARHTCEPDRYPSGPGERWTCPDCGRNHESFYVNDDPRTPEVVKRHLCGPTWGWRSTGPEPPARSASPQSPASGEGGGAG